MVFTSLYQTISVFLRILDSKTRTTELLFMVNQARLRLFGALQLHHLCFRQNREILFDEAGVAYVQPGHSLADVTAACPLTKTTFVWKHGCKRVKPWKTNEDRMSDAECLLAFLLDINA